MLPAMLCSRVRQLTATTLATFALLLGACSPGAPKLRRPDVAPIVAGVTEQTVPAAVRGRVLLGELGCTACHGAGDAQIEHRTGPDLQAVGSRVFGDYLDDFIATPHAVEPGTTMPDLLRHLDSDDARQTATALRHYVQSFSSDRPSNSSADADAQQRGKELFTSIGCRTCHATNDGRLLWQPKYSVATLQQFLLDPHAVRPDGRMPAMDLTPAQAFDLAHFVLSSTSFAGIRKGPTDKRLVAEGRQHFVSYGCANCHRLEDGTRPATKQSKALIDVDAQQGCLSGTTGTWPHYALTPGQRDDIRAALASLTKPVAGIARVQQLMASRNCYACHSRDDVNGLTSHEDDFLTHDASIGQDGRIPPDLTGVGGKLQRDWLQNTIAHGQMERPYLVTRMPGFGDAFGETLTAALTAVDEVPDVTVKPKPKDRKKAEVIKKLGRELVGDKGMNCITCHLFAGEKAGAMGAIDLVHSTGKRLRPEWFSAFLRDPFEFKAITLMPKFYPNGKSTRPEFADGDPQRQIDAMWHYLATGRNVGKPRGMRHPPIELEVKDSAVMLRRSVQNTGKRGISVGYPGGVNITFDAESIALNQIWWGRFLDARPVWTGQGSGQANILSRQRAQLGKGPVFAEVDNDGAWPTTTRRERGDRFLGYDLDEQERPTFRYTAGKLTIEDKPEQATVDGKTVLRRTLTLTGERSIVHFLAARAAKIERVDERTVRVGKHLLIHTGDELASIVPGEKEQELRLMINVEQNTATVDLEYSWTGEQK